MACPENLTFPGRQTSVWASEYFILGTTETGQVVQAPLLPLEDVALEIFPLFRPPLPVLALEAEISLDSIFGQGMTFS